MKKKTQKELKAERRAQRWYGMKKLHEGEKVCWLAKQDKHGYSLGLALGKRTLWLRNLRIPNVHELKRVIKSSILFIHLKDIK